MAGQLEAIQAELESLGLTTAGAALYVALVTEGPAGAQTLAERVGIRRSSAYAALRRLGDLGLVEAGAGYASVFSAVPPEKAVPSLVDHERAEITARLQKRETASKQVVQELSELAVGHVPLSGPPPIVEVIRSGRAVADRFTRLLLEAKETVESLVKPPLVVHGANPAALESLNRGVRTRSLFQMEAIEKPGVAPQIAAWIAAGEQVRVFDGQLPFKLALFDQEMALMPLEDRTSGSGYTGILIRSQALGRGLRILFDSLWETSRPYEHTDIPTSAGNNS